MLNIIVLYVLTILPCICHRYVFETNNSNLNISNSILVHQNKCLSKTHAPIYTRDMNKIFDYDGITQKLPGRTYWINDYMAVGHAMYDIQLIELLRLKQLDRIVFQRAPCATSDLCRGLGTWISFYRGLYNTIMYASKQNSIPIYLRFHRNDNKWKPYILGPYDWSQNNSFQSIKVSKDLCFDTLIRRKCNACFYNSISEEAVRDFKNITYNHLSIEDINTIKNYNKKIITIAHRGYKAKRHMINPQDLLAYLESKFTSNQESLKVKIQLFDTSNKTMSHLDQIRIALISNVIIATHGGFISNVMYMRENSMLIQLIGNYSNVEPLNFEMLAKMFLVKYKSIIVSNLTNHHHQQSYTISDNEMNEISKTVKIFINNMTLI